MSYIHYSRYFHLTIASVSDYKTSTKAINIKICEDRDTQQKKPQYCCFNDVRVTCCQKNMIARE